MATPRKRTSTMANKTEKSVSAKQAIVESQAEVAANETVIEQLVDSAAEVSEQDLEIQALKEQLAAMQALLQATEQIKEVVPSSEKTYREPVTISNIADQKEFVTIVHLMEMADGLTTFIKLSNSQIEFRKLGQQRTLSIREFEELASKYASWFDNGTLAVHIKDMDIAEREMVGCYDPSDKSQLHPKTLKNLPNMSEDELVELFNGLSYNAQQHFLSYWGYKAYEKTPGFYDESKLGKLNKASDSTVFDLLRTEILNSKRKG